MRLAALTAFAVLFVFACERAEETPAPEPAPRIDIPVSDELPGLGAAVTGIAFWDHPTLSFNSMMIVANAEGATAYNIEDGLEVARIDGVASQGAAVSYLGLGAQAAGVLALYDASESAFKLYGIDNISRQFLPINGGPAIDGAVRDFCFGRADGADAPSLFVLQLSRILIFNFIAADAGVAVEGEGVLNAPDNLASCAVDLDGVLLAATEDGAVYRVDGENSFDAPFIQTTMTETGDLVVLATNIEDETSQSVSSQIALLDKADGALHVFDRESGTALGVIAVAATDQMPGVETANAMGATSGNLGALYRNGAVAFAVTAEDNSTARLVPYGAVQNALSLPAGTALSPRGKAPVVVDDDNIIRTPFIPE